MQLLNSKFSLLPTSTAKSTLLLPTSRSIHSVLFARSFLTRTDDSLKLSRTHCSFSPFHYPFSKNALRISLHCSLEHNRSPGPSCAHSSQQIHQHDAQRNISTAARILASFVLLAGITFSFHSAPACASHAATTASSNSIIASGSWLVRVLGGAEVVTSAWTGLMAGCLHTLTGPDHLAALAPLSIGHSKLESIAIGALWGCGHDAGQVIFGILFLLLKDRLHIELLRSWGARVVGITLLAIGALGMKEARDVAVPCIAADDSSQESTLQPAAFGKRKIGLATFATGIIHGLQPDALLMVLPALALPSRVAGIAFLSMFLFGTVLAMASYTAFIGSCSQALRKHTPKITEQLSWGSSILAIFIGLIILVNERFGGRLF